MSYATQYTASHPGVPSPNFTQRMEMGLEAAAQNIYSESVTTPGHAARAALANRIVQPGGAAAFAPGFVELAASTPQGALACDATTTDAQIDGVTSSAWNAVANA